jgi:hypothetical protein
MIIASGGVRSRFGRARRRACVGRAPLDEREVPVMLSGIRHTSGCQPVEGSSIVGRPRLP